MQLFVYGTLKKPFTNYERYLKVAVNSGKAVFVGHARTLECYPLVLRPWSRKPATRGPMLLTSHNSDPSEWHSITGEVYKIDENTFEAMDILEGVRSGYYYRKPIEVGIGTDYEELVVCQCYFYSTQPGDAEILDARPLLPSYDEIAHSEYLPGPLNEEIMSLLYSQGTAT